MWNNFRHFIVLWWVIVEAIKDSSLLAGLTGSMVALAGSMVVLAGSMVVPGASVLLITKLPISLARPD